jgi:hypothetical protein
MYNGPSKSKTTTQKTNWAKFTHIGREMRFITKLFKSFDIGISFTARNNIDTRLRESNDNLDNKYNRSGVYQLTCTECNKKYIGQKGRPFLIRYKEHAREYTHNGRKYNFAKHLLDHQHALRPIEDCMTLIHTVTKGPMNTMEKFHIYKETMNNSHLNDRSTVTRNAIFETLLRSSSDMKLEPKHNSTFTRPLVTH